MYIQTKEGTEAMANDQKGRGRARGKWSDPNVPHKGWTCMDIVDLAESNYEICEMCEAREIRFVHIMEHPRYPGSLRCGCVCAGHLEANYKAARDRERGLKQAAGKRQRASERLQRASELLQRAAPVIARAQKWHTAAKAVATGPTTDWEREFTADMISRLGHDYKYVNRMTDKQKRSLLGLFEQHLRRQQSNTVVAPASSGPCYSACESRQWAPVNPDPTPAVTQNPLRHSAPQGVLQPMTP
jgi:hypothetical protein